MNHATKINALVALFVGIVVSVFALNYGAYIFHQERAAFFPTVTGAITRSEVTTSRGSKGAITYGTDIQYDYEVDGTQYHGSRLRYGLAITDVSMAQAAVLAHPVGSETTVYYRAGNPGDSLLSPGVEGRDLLLAFFILPFIVFTKFCAGKVTDQTWFKLRKLPAGGVKIISRGNRTRVRLPIYSPLDWTLAMLAVASFASFLALSLGIIHALSLRSVALAAGQVLAVTAGVFSWRQSRLMSGIDDLVIDDDARTVRLPLTFGRNRPISLAFNYIESVFVKSIPHGWASGRVTYTWDVMLAFLYVPGSPAALTDWPSEEKSAAFANWLRERLRLAKPAAQAAA